MKLNEFKKGSGPALNFARKATATASPQERPIRPRSSREFNKKFPKNLSENLKMLWQNWYGARILILGFGKEGIDNFLFLRKLFPQKTIGIADRNKKTLSYNFYGRGKSTIKTNTAKGIEKKVKLHLGEDYLKALKNYDVIIKSPGIPIHLPEVEKAYKQRKITSQTEIFLENFRGKIIGVTGTKGKGTTASLIYEILKTAGLKVRLGGNIGKPVMAALLKNDPNEIFVYEISSHQLYNITKSPQIAVFLNISPAHLDYYKNFKEYIRTKANITKYQKKNDFLIYNSGDKIIGEIAKKSKAKKISFSAKNAIEFFKRRNKSPRKDINFLNMAAAISVGKIFGVSPRIIIKAIEKFKGLPHRLAFVGTHRGILFYDDSAATVPEATFHALKTLGNRVQTIILGGYESNVSFKELAKNILNSEIKTLILFPPAGERIWKDIASQGKSKKLPQHFFINNMKDAVKISYQETEKGKICLLSCAVPSFGIFKDYKERGNLFKKYVKLFGN